MFIKLLLAFIFVPVMELYILIEAGRIVGIGPTIALIMLTGIAGALLARSQGVAILRRIQDETARGQMPAATLIDGALVLVGGLLLLTPGFFTDLLGFSFLVPSTRDLWRNALNLWLEKQVRQGSVRIHRM
ncbi:MAG: membrane protein FxsA [Desulfuromonadales bacterium]|nr:membrane protein FxsA [Desulfuromonadales bacterium]